MEVIVLFASLLVVGIASALLTDFFFDCMADNMILGQWGEIVKDKFWLKPLGGCLICTNFWITALLIGIYFLQPIIVVIVFTFGLSNYLIKKLNG